MELTQRQRIQSIAKLLRSGGYRHDRHRVFSDCMEAMAIGFARLDRSRAEQREARFLDIQRAYAGEDATLFARVLAETALALEDGPNDILGAVFGELEVGNADRGQFFTPYEVSKLLAVLQIGDGSHARELIAAHGFITVHEPAVGSGGLVIAMAEALAEAGINYQRHMHVTAIDVDARAAHMAFVQLSMLHIPAVVIVGNTITLECRDYWYTPAHILGRWGTKLAERRAAEADAQQEKHPKAPEAADVRQMARHDVVLQPASQLALF